MNNYEIVVLRAAKIDLEEIIDWYESQKIGLGLNFFREVQEMFSRLTINPLVYQENFLFVRKAVLFKYPYSIFYAVNEVDLEIEILAILHQRINPVELQKRINFL